MSRSLSMDARIWEAIDILCDKYDVKAPVVASKFLREGIRDLGEADALKALGETKLNPFDPLAPKHPTIPQTPYEYSHPVDTTPIEIPAEVMLPSGFGATLERVRE